MSKVYNKCKLSDVLYNDDLSIDNKVVSTLLRKYSGMRFSTIDDILAKTNREFIINLANVLVPGELTFLVSDKNVLGITEGDRDPVLNTVFVSTVKTHIVNTNLEISEIYSKSDTSSSILLKRTTPITVELDNKSYDYTVGVLLENDELSNAHARLVMYMDDIPVYLPLSNYSLTNARYRKTTGSDIEALEVLMLRVVDDFREDMLVDRVLGFHKKLSKLTSITATYEEYKSLLDSINKAIISMEGYSEDVTIDDNMLDYFTANYGDVDIHSKSFLWRCTAIAPNSVMAIITEALNILNQHKDLVGDYASGVRELLGEYISTRRISQEIAKKTVYNVT